MWPPPEGRSEQDGGGASSSGWILEKAAGVLPHAGTTQETGHEEHSPAFVGNKKAAGWTGAHACSAEGTGRSGFGPVSQ